MNNHKKMCKDLYLHYSENGICTKCGAAWSLAGHVLCRECFKKAKQTEKKSDPTGEKKRERMRKLREDRKKAGVCVSCGKRKPSENHVDCPECLAKHRERDLLKRIDKKIKKGLF